MDMHTPRSGLSRMPEGFILGSTLRTPANQSEAGVKILDHTKWAHQHLGLLSQCARVALGNNRPLPPQAECRVTTEQVSSPDHRTHFQEMVVHYGDTIFTIGKIERNSNTGASTFVPSKLLTEGRSVLGTNDQFIKTAGLSPAELVLLNRAMAALIPSITANSTRAHVADAVHRVTARGHA